MKITIYTPGEHPEMGEQDLILTAEVYGDGLPSGPWGPGYSPEVELPELVTVDGGEFNGAQIALACVEASEDSLISDVLMEYAEHGGNF